MNKIDILGVKVDSITFSECLSKINSFTKDSKKHLITTTNPEFILTAQTNTRFKQVLNSSDISVPDGYGILLASKFINEVSKIRKNMLSPLLSLLKGAEVGLRPFFDKKYLNIISERVAGSDLMLEILKKYSNSNYSIYLIGTKYQNGDESANATSKLIQERFSSFKFVGSCSGRVEIQTGKFGYLPKNEVLSKIDSDLKLANLQSVDFMFVSFGHPRQELWISENMKELPAKVFMGIGASFDFLSGKVQRAPEFYKHHGLEWLFRLFLAFSFDRKRGQLGERVKRVLRAFPYFPLLVFVKYTFGKEKEPL